jgi:hypothetical protein
MIRISNNTSKVISIKRYYKETDDSTDVDSFVIIPGVTIYSSIYQRKNTLVFVEQTGNSLIVEFLSEGDLERFFIQLMRDTKLNQLMYNVDPKNNING